VSTGGDVWAATTGIGLVTNGQLKKKRKLSCASSAKELTGKTEDKKKRRKITSATAETTTTTVDLKKTNKKKRTNKKKSRRKTKWNVEPGLSVVRKAIHLYRNGVGNSVQIKRLLNVPARTLMRYVAESMEPMNKLFYVPETSHERRGRELQEVGVQHGLYSSQSFEAAVHYTRPRPVNISDEIIAAEVAASNMSKKIENAPKPDAPKPKNEPEKSFASTATLESHTVSNDTFEDWSLDIDGTLLALEGPLLNCEETKSPRLPSKGSFDFGMIDFLSDLGATGSESSDGLTIVSPGLFHDSSSRLRRSHSLSSIGDILNDVIDLPLDNLPLDGMECNVLDVDCSRNPSENNQLLECAWESQRKQLVSQQSSNICSFW
jgi:hypothetical protein